MFSGGFSIADLSMQVVWVGDSGGWLAPQSLGFFQMTGFFQINGFFPRTGCRCL